MAAPRDRRDLLGKKWYLFWAVRLGEDGIGGSRLLTAWPYTLTALPCLSFYFGLVLSANKWSALGRRGDRDPKDPDGEPTLPFSCASDPEHRHDVSQLPSR